MRLFLFLSLCCAILCLLEQIAYSQDIFLPDTIQKEIHAVAIQAHLRIDGKLEEAEWQLAKPVSNFVQVEPLQGEGANHDTEVRVLYNKHFLYIAAFCRDSLGKSAIRTPDMRRDFNFQEHDFFGIAIDAFNDKRNAMTFMTNAYGTQRDLLSFDDRLFDTDWDGLWRVRTQRTDEGWIAEIAIPWQTLRYPASAEKTQSWGINFFRNRRKTNELTAWSPYPRAFSVLRMEYAGMLKDIQPPPPSPNVRVQPYILGVADKYKGNEVKIKAQNPTLEDMGYIFKKEFKLSNDAHFFFRTPKAQTLPFCEGRMIEAYTYQNNPKYFIPREKAHTQLLSQEVSGLKKRFHLSQKNYEIIGIFNEKGFLLDYESERLVIKLPTTAQDRSMVAALLPSNTFAESNLLYLSNFSYSRNEKDLLQEAVNQEDLVFLLALFNSFTLNFYIQKVGMSEVSLLPFPKLIHRKEKQALKSQIVLQAFTILSNQNEHIFNDLGKKIGIENAPTIIHPLYSDLRLGLESLIAREVFELSEEEFEYIKGLF
jgi:hypothetical protein